MCCTIDNDVTCRCLREEQFMVLVFHWVLKWTTVISSSSRSALLLIFQVCIFSFSPYFAPVHRTFIILNLLLISRHLNLLHRMKYFDAVIWVESHPICKISSVAIPQTWFLASCLKHSSSCAGTECTSMKFKVVAM